MCLQYTNPFHTGQNDNTNRYVPKVDTKKLTEPRDFFNSSPVRYD